MSLTLRDYQVEGINNLRLSMRHGKRAIVYQLPTGGGKTAMAAAMLGTAASRGARCVFTVHRRELVKQSMRAFALEGIRHGVIAAGMNGEDPSAMVQIASIQTLARRFHKVLEPSLVVVDEAHHSAAKSWQKLWKEWPRAVKIGLTATPERLDGKGLDSLFEHMIHGPTVQHLIENGYLADYRIYAPPGVDVGGIGTVAGDYNKGQLAAAADRSTITGCAIQHYKKLAMGKRAVAFCVCVEHSKHVVEHFNREGIPAAHVDGDTSAHERDRTLERFAAGEILVLGNCELFGEGFDLPALEVSILLRPTHSLALYLQQVGRCLRPSPGKTYALVLDHAGNVERHGLPDEDRPWSLAGRPKDQQRSDSDGPSVRKCPNCYAVQLAFRPVCQACGHVFDRPAFQIDQSDGELVEIDTAAARKQRVFAFARAETERELIAYAEAQGIKRPRLYARHIMMQRAARQRREAVG